MNFFDSNFCQTIVLVLTIIGTFAIYFIKEWRSLKAATTILVLQIKNIERNIEYLKAHGIIGTAISETPLHYSVPIFEDNAWDKYKHLFAAKLSSSDFATIEQFYETAQAIKTTQTLIKKKIEESLAAKSANYYNAKYGRIIAFTFFNEVDSSKLFNDLQRFEQIYNTVNIQTYMPIEFYNGLSQGLNSYVRLSGTTTLNNLRIKGHLGKE